MTPLSFIPSPPRILRRAFRRFILRQDGASILEAGIVLPVFFLLFFGICQFGIVMFSYLNATYALRQATRYASVHSSTSLSPVTQTQLQTLVKSKLYFGSAYAPKVTVTYLTTGFTTGSNSVGNYVVVQTTWSQVLMIPFASSNSFSIGTSDFRMITR